MKEWWTKKLTEDDLRASWIRDNSKRYEFSVTYRTAEQITIQATSQGEAEDMLVDVVDGDIEDIEFIGEDDAIY